MHVLGIIVVFIGSLSFGTLAAEQARKETAPTVKPAAARAAAMRTVDIVGTDDMKYNVTTIPARRGEQLRLRLTVTGVIPKVAMAHNVVVLKAGTDIQKLLTAGASHRATDFIPPDMQSAVIAKTAFAGPGETVEIVFTAPSRPGNYPYVCTFAGHYQAGMKGMMVVK
jgi:azurin